MASGLVPRGDEPRGSSERRRISCWAGSYQREAQKIGGLASKGRAYCPAACSLSYRQVLISAWRLMPRSSASRSSIASICSGNRVATVTNSAASGLEPQRRRHLGRDLLPLKPFPKLEKLFHAQQLLHLGKTHRLRCQLVHAAGILPLLAQLAHGPRANHQRFDGANHDLVAEFF